jgi:hypothetical protein
MLIQIFTKQVVTLYNDMFFQQNVEPTFFVIPTL